MAWPTNAATVLCTIIDGALLIITLVIFYFFSSKARNYLQTAKAIRSPMSQSARRKRQRSGVSAEDMERQHSELNSFVFYGSWTACSLLLLANTFAFLYTLNSQSELEFCGGACRPAMVNVQIVSIGLAKILSHVIYVRRLEMSFKGASTLQYSRWVFVLFYSVLAIAVFVLAVLILLILVFQNLVLYTIVGAAVFSLDAIVSIVVLLMFTSKLHQVVIQRKNASVRDVTRELELNAPDKQIAGTMTKLTVLSCLNAFGALCLFIVFTFRGARNTGDDDEDVWVVVYVANVAFMLCATINCLALYVVLPFAATHYDRMCGCPHQFIKRCCEHGLRAALNRRREKVHARMITESRREMENHAAMSVPQTPQSPQQALQKPQASSTYEDTDGRSHEQVSSQPYELTVTASVDTTKQTSSTYEDDV